MYIRYEKYKIEICLICVTSLYYNCNNNKKRKNARHGVE